MRGGWVPATHHADRSEAPGASRERRAYRGLRRDLRRARQSDVPNRAEVESQPADREQEGAEDAERRGVAAQLVGRLVSRVEPAGSRPDDLGGKEGHDTFLARGGAAVSACVPAPAGIVGPRTSCQVNDAGAREVIGAAQDRVLVRPRQPPAVGPQPVHHSGIDEAGHCAGQDDVGALLGALGDCPRDDGRARGCVQVAEEVDALVLALSDVDRLERCLGVVGQNSPTKEGPVGIRREHGAKCGPHHRADAYVHDVLQQDVTHRSLANSTRLQHGEAALHQQDDDRHD